MIIPPPPAKCEPEDRHLLCQGAVEIAVQDLVAAAIAAGWEEQDVLVAVSTVADHLVLAKRANEELLGILRDLHARKPR